MANLPENQAEFLTNPMLYITAVALIALAMVPTLFGAKINNGYTAYWLVAIAFVVIALVAVDREIIRWFALVVESGYNPMDYPINMDWYSTILFFATFAVVGGMACLPTHCCVAGGSNRGDLHSICGYLTPRQLDHLHHRNLDRALLCRRILGMGTVRR